MSPSFYKKLKAKKLISKKIELTRQKIFKETNVESVKLQNT